MFEEPPARRGKWKGEATTQEHTPFLGKHPWAPKGGQKYRLTPFGDAFMRASAVSNVGVCCRRDFIVASIEERLWPLGMTFNKLSAREVEKAENLANKSLTAAMEALVRFRFFQPSGAPGAYRMTEIGEHYFLELKKAKSPVIEAPIVSHPSEKLMPREIEVPALRRPDIPQPLGGGFPVQKTYRDNSDRAVTLHKK